MSMNEKQRQQFIAISKLYPKVGYVHVGQGKDIYVGNLTECFATHQAKIYATSPSNRQWENGWSGNDPTMRYYLTTEKWNQIFGKREFNTMEERLAYAKSFIGKTIKSIRTGNIRLVTEIEMYFNNNVKGGNPSFDIIENLNRVLAKDGYCMVFRSTGSEYPNLFFVIDFDNLSDFEVVTNQVTINGYTSVDKGDYFEFGCAHISKAFLKQARILMTMDSTTVSNNRKVKTITIGEGTFTLEDINTLLS